MSGRNREPGRSVLDKALAILDALRAAQASLTLAQLTRRTGLPESTVRRIAGELLEHGVLERRGLGAYGIGPWVWEIATLSVNTRSIHDIAIPFLEDLYEATHENVHLAVLDGHDALIVEKIRGRHSVPITSRVGSRLPLHATGAGKAILAFSAPAFVDEMVATGLSRYTPSTITDGDRLRRDLRETRRRGFALSLNELSPNAASVAAPILDGAGDVVGAVSIIVDSRRADAASLAAPVQTVARSLGRLLTPVLARGSGPDA